jgi:hypothetical protein
VRDSDLDRREPGAGKHERQPKSEPRTLHNSSVKSWSWPCILVVVREWQTLQDLTKWPEDVVTPFVYMPEGRIVPVCVVLAASALPPRAVDPSQLTASTLGASPPIYVDAQGIWRMGTIACMVSDGSDFYLLTNTHLAGQAGRPVRALLRGAPQVVGSTSGYTPPDGTNLFRSLSGSAWQGLRGQY